MTHECNCILDFHTKEGHEANIAFGGLRGRGVKKQDPPIERELHLALEDLFYGCTKKIKISRRVSLKFFHHHSVFCIIIGGTTEISFPFSLRLSLLFLLSLAGYE